MIKHIFKIIWAERKINLWILLELILVFCVLWFCTDYLGAMFKKTLEPNSWNIEHTYRIDIKDKGSKTPIDTKTKIADLWTIYDRVKKHPAVESIAYSFVSTPYSGSWYGSGGYAIDTLKEGGVQMKWVTPEFFDVYQIELLHGTGFNANNSLSEKNIVISAGEENLFAKTPMETITAVTNHQRDGKIDSLNVVGVVQRTKRSEYEKYNPVVYTALRRDSENLANSPELSVRVKPDADHNFKETFMKEMYPQLQVGNFYLSGVESLAEAKVGYHKWRGVTDNFRNIYAISFFLILNIFLGIIGTFWFRIQTRRSEVGLRIAMGASKVNVKTMFVTETSILLFLASIIATVICINVGMTDFIKDLGLPIIWGREPGFEDYITSYLVTFASLAAIAIVAVWYPAKKASQVYPAEALRDQ